MEAKELRIGNWVQSSSNKEYQINLSWYECCKNSTEGRDIQLDTLPIPLTEEWLKKFGFEYDDVVTGENRTEKGMFKGFLMMLTHPNGKLWYACPYGYPINPHRTIYVHQLQNLYFALTGEELKKQE